SGMALDDDEVCLCVGIANGLCNLILGAAIAGNGRCVILKLNDHVALTGAALHLIVAAAADEKPCAVFLKSQSRCRQVVGIPLGVANRDTNNPVAIRHDVSPFRCDLLHPVHRPLAWRADLLLAGAGTPGSTPCRP